MTGCDSRFIIGVDPGAISGAWAAIEAKSGLVKLAEDLPVVDRMICPSAWASDIEDLMAMGGVEAIVEAVHSFPGQGVSSSFRFGQGYGTILGVLGAMKIPVRLVPPVKWKRALGLDRDGEKSRALAISLYPAAASLMSKKLHHNRAEALLLAHYRLKAI